MKISGNTIVPKVEFDKLPAAADRFLPNLNYTDKNNQPKKAVTVAELIRDALYPAANVATPVKEKKSIYIGAPTADEIRRYGNLNESLKMRFIKNDSEKPNLSGFERVTLGERDHYTNTGVMVCDGDLFVDGVVFLNNLQLKTEVGCRIHTTRTVFIQGPIEYVDEYALSNLQVMSSRAIYMGMGLCYDCHADDPDGAGPQAPVKRYNTNFFLDRVWAMEFYSSEIRAGRIYGSYKDTMLADMKLVSATESNIPRPAAGVDLKAYYAQKFTEAGITLVDANSEIFLDANGKNPVAATSFRRLFLNAPDVQSRYEGDFTGSVVAEFAMWKLGNFHFKFDSVFTAVPVFPLVDISKVIKIED